MSSRPPPCNSRPIFHPHDERNLRASGSLEDAEGNPGFVRIRRRKFTSPYNCADPLAVNISSQQPRRFRASVAPDTALPQCPEDDMEIEVPKYIDSEQMLEFIGFGPLAARYTRIKFFEIEETAQSNHRHGLLRCALDLLFRTRFNTHTAALVSPGHWAPKLAHYGASRSMIDAVMRPGTDELSPICLSGLPNKRFVEFVFARHLFLKFGHYMSRSRNAAFKSGLLENSIACITPDEARRTEDRRDEKNFDSADFCRFPHMQTPAGARPSTRAAGTIVLWKAAFRAQVETLFYEEPPTPGSDFHLGLQSDDVRSDFGPGVYFSVDLESARMHQRYLERGGFPHETCLIRLELPNLFLSTLDPQPLQLEWPSAKFRKIVAHCRNGRWLENLPGCPEISNCKVIFGPMTQAEWLRVDEITEADIEESLLIRYEGRIYDPKTRVRRRQRMIMRQCCLRADDVNDYSFWNQFINSYRDSNGDIAVTLRHPKDARVVLPPLLGEERVMKMQESDGRV